MWVSAFVYLYDGLNSRTKLVLRLTFQTLQATDFLLYKNFKYFDYSSRQTIEVEFILFKKDFENEGEKSWAPLLLYRAFVFKSGPVSFLLVDCVNRHSCDADCRKSAILRRWLVRVRCIPITCSCEVCLFWLARSVRSTSRWTQISSEMNCIAKNKCPESQKLDTRRKGENLNATDITRVLALKCLRRRCFSVECSSFLNAFSGSPSHETEISLKD